MKKNAPSDSIKNKFLELMNYNSRSYNGEFSIDILLNKKDEKTKEKIQILLGKLLQKEIISKSFDGYYKFNHLYTPKYAMDKLKEEGFNEEEISIIKPIYEQTRQLVMDSKFAIKNSAKNYPDYLLEKMKERKIIYSNKKDKNENIYWMECFKDEASLRNRLNEAGFDFNEQNLIIENWHKENKTGFDLSGLKYIDENIAVYSYQDKINNWTKEKTNWITNSTALATSEGKTPFVGVSMVHFDDRKPVLMSDIRSEEILHEHPNVEEKRQSEIYLITSGAAALNVVKNGKAEVRIIKEGELAVIAPGVAHCINSIMGEYEQIVTQLPSAFQYGFGFKKTVDLPQGYDQKALEKEAFEKLEALNLEN